MSGTVLCCERNLLELCKENWHTSSVSSGDCLFRATSFSGPYETTFATSLLALKTNVIDVSVLHSTCRVSVHGSRLQLGCFMFSIICSCSGYLSFNQSFRQQNLKNSRKGCCVQFTYLLYLSNMLFVNLELCHGSGG
jgi:hypothetical protein